MLTSIQLTNYRGFSQFKLEGLKRVTLLVGENNAGKTSVLEAAKILAYGASPFSLIDIMTRRGERFPESDEMPENSLLDVAHFFHGHTSAIGARFSVRGETLASLGVDCHIDAYQAQVGDEAYDFVSGARETDPEPFGYAWDELAMQSRALRIDGYNNVASTTVPLSPSGGLSIPAARGAAKAGINLFPVPELFIPPAGLAVRDLARLWNLELLDSRENEVIDALRLVEPSLLDLQYVSDGGSNAVHRKFFSGFFAKLTGVSSRVPLGTSGDGVKRLLSLALAFGRVRGGYLLVDEIDSGLHYTTLPKMWKLVIQTARRLNVQVLATTHSGDCVRSLALLHQEAPELTADAALHRIERGLPESIPFSAEELAIGARQHMEFR